MKLDYYRTALIIKIERAYDRYQRWLAETDNKPDTPTLVKGGEVVGLIEALNMLDGVEHDINDCLKLYEELKK